MLLAWRALKAFHAASFWGERSLQVIMFLWNPHVPFHKVGILAPLQLSFVPGVVYAPTEDHPWTEEMQGNIVTSMGHLGGETQSDQCPHDHTQTKAGCRWWLSGYLPWTLPGCRHVFSATSSLLQIPPWGVPKNTCVSAHPGEGVGLMCAMRMKIGSKRSNLDLTTSTGQLKCNIYIYIYAYIN